MAVVLPVTYMTSGGSRENKIFVVSCNRWGYLYQILYPTVFNFSLKESKRCINQVCKLLPHCQLGMIRIYIQQLKMREVFIYCPWQCWEKLCSGHFLILQKLKPSCN